MFNFKKLSKTEIVALILFLFLGLDFYLRVPPLQTEAAAGDVIVLWDGADIPSGWTCVSCAVTDPFFGVFPRASSTYASASSSNDMQAHTLTYSSATQGTAVGQNVSTAGTASPISTHAHTWGNPNLNSGDVRPPFQDLKFISAATTTVPNGTIAIFDATSTANLPTNWTNYTALNGNYLRGANDASTGGAATHTHTTASTLNAASSSGSYADAGAGLTTASGVHSHAIAAGSSLTADNNAPPYITVVFAQVSTTSTLPSGIIAFFDNASLSSGWSSISTSGSAYAGNLLKGGTSFGATGGSTTHSHGGSIVFTSGGPSATFANKSGSAANTNTNTHTHGVTYTVSTSSSWPVYRDVILAKYTSPLPGAPGTPTFSSTGTSTVTVSWTEGSNATSYKLERAPDSGGAPGTFSEIATPAGVSYDDSGRTPNTTYWYRVRSSNGSGDSGYSGNASVLMLAGSPGTNTYANIAATTLTVNWTAPADGASSYRLERSADGNSFSEIASTTALTYGETGRSENTIYFYRARSTNPSGNGPYNASSSVLTLPGSPGTPAYASTNTSTVTVNWTAPTGGAAYYRIGRSTNGNTFVQAATTTSLTYNATGSPNTAYWYRLTATNATGDGAVGASSSVLMLANAPGTPTYASTGTSTVTINWTEPSGSADYYRLERSTSGNAFSEAATTTQLTYAETGRTPNTTYFYRLRSANGSGNGPYSASSSVLLFPGIPGTPTFANISTSTFTVNWTAPTGGTDYYRLERAADVSGSPGNYSEIATTTALTYNATSSPDTTFWYRLRAVNTTGNGNYSAEASVLTVPGPPGTPTYSSITTTSFTVSWTAPADGATYYRYERSTDGNSFSELSTTTALSYNESGRSANTSYYYRVRGANATGDGSYSASSSALTLPGAPGTATFSNVLSSSITVGWTAPTGGASSYKIERAPDSGGSPGTYAQVGTTSSLAYVNTGLSPATTYWYRVRATNSSGDGAYGGEAATSTPSNSSPSAPSSDAPTNGTQNVSLTPVFRMTATDSDSDALRYKVALYSNSGCTTLLQTYDQSSSQTGWSGQNATCSVSNDCYTSGTQGVYTVQSALTANTTYYWKPSAKDPQGTNAFVDGGSCNSFTTTSGNWTTDSGSWSVASNRLQVSPAAATTVQIHVTAISRTNGVLEVRAKASAVGATTGNTALMARGDTGSNRYQLGDLNVAGQLHRIGKVISDVYSTLTSGAKTFSADTFYVLRANLSVSALSAWNDGGTALSASDGSLTGAGYWGLIATAVSGGSVTFTYDDFAVYSSTTIAMTGLPGGGSWSVRDSGGNAVSCRTGSTWDLSTYSGQVPIDYANGGGSVAVWRDSASCSGLATAVYPSSGLAADVFGGDSYSYSGGGEDSRTGTASSTITITASGLINLQ